jgi:hypothetical protein
VALDLATRGHELWALDSDSELVAALARRARELGLKLETAVADARSFELPRRFALAIAPMQVVQLLGESPGRCATLERVRAHLEPGGVFAAALADPFEAVAPAEALPPLPDVLEQEGWVLSSRPVAVREERGAVAVDRLRQCVSPSGELREELSSVRIETVSPDGLEREASAVGLEPAGRLAVPPTADHVGSTVVLLAAP